MNRHVHSLPGWVRRRVLRYTDRKRLELLERPGSPERERDLRFVAELEAEVMGPITPVVQAVARTGCAEDVGG
jgi:hypothetical protein